jgi:uncharacterized membrane protein YjgN (DUF898 family)
MNDTAMTWNAPSQELAIEFHGTTRDYFRIWIVNLCLTLLSLGIFSAWAKVRKKRYLYSHTLLDRTPFQYLGLPMPILKGRIAAAILFVIYYASSHLFTTTLPYVIAAGLVLAPWVLSRAAAFNARYSAYRNMTFTFDGSYFAAMRRLYAWGIVPLLAIGSAFSWWNNPAYAGAAFGLFGLFFPFWQRGIKHFIVNHSSYGGERGNFSARNGQFFKAYLMSGLILMATFGSVAALAILMRQGGIPWQALFLLVPLLYLGYILSHAYLQARIGNLSWNHTTLGPIEFKSTLSPWGLAKIYAVNLIAIIASLGLLIPWAVIRTHRYRAQHMQAFSEGAMENLRGSGRTAVQATAAEVGEFFDLDISL